MLLNKSLMSYKRYMSYHLAVELLSYQNSKTLLGSYKNTSFLIGKVQVCLTQLR